MAEERLTGKVDWFRDVGGYGFIIPKNGGENLLFHRSSIRSDGRSSFRTRESVEYDIGINSCGKPEAFNVISLDGPPWKVYGEQCSVRGGGWKGGDRRDGGSEGKFVGTLPADKKISGDDTKVTDICAAFQECGVSTKEAGAASTCSFTSGSKDEDIKEAFGETRAGTESTRTWSSPSRSTDTDIFQDAKDTDFFQDAKDSDFLASFPETPQPAVPIDEAKAALLKKEDSEEEDSEEDDSAEEDSEEDDSEEEDSDEDDLEEIKKFEEVEETEKSKNLEEIKKNFALPFARAMHKTMSSYAHMEFKHIQLGTQAKHLFEGLRNGTITPESLAETYVRNLPDSLDVKDEEDFEDWRDRDIYYPSVKEIEEMALLSVRRRE